MIGDYNRTIQDPPETGDDVLLETETALITGDFIDPAVYLFIFRSKFKKIKPKFSIFYISNK